jgi:hypothetical protein
MRVADRGRGHQTGAGWLRLLAAASILVVGGAIAGINRLMAALANIDGDGSISMGTLLLAVGVGAVSVLAAASVALLARRA